MQLVARKVSLHHVAVVIALAGVVALTAGSISYYSNLIEFQQQQEAARWALADYRRQDVWANPVLISKTNPAIMRWIVEDMENARIAKDDFDKFNALSRGLILGGAAFFAFGSAYILWDSRRRWLTALSPLKLKRRLLTSVATRLVRIVIAVAALWMGAVWLWGIIVDWTVEMEGYQYAALMVGPPILFMGALMLARWVRSAQHITDQ